MHSVIGFECCIGKAPSCSTGEGRSTLSFLVILTTSFFLFELPRRVLINSSSRAALFATALVYTGSGARENKCERTCSAMRSFVLGEIRGILYERSIYL